MLGASDFAREYGSDKIAVAGSQSAIKKLHKSRSSELKSESESILPKSKKTVDPEDEPIPGTVSIGNKGSKGLNPKTTRRQNTHVVAVDVSWNSTGVIASSTDVDIGLFHVNPRFLGPVTYVITSAACAPTQKTVRSAILDLNTNTMVHRTDTVELKPGDIKPILGEAKTVQAFFNATMVYPDHCVVMKRKNLPVARIESDKQLVLDSPHNARESVVVDIGAWYGVVLHSTLCKCLMSRRKFHNATVTEFHSKFGTKPHDKKEGPIGAYFADTNQLLSVTDAKLEMLLPYYAAACELSEESTKIIDHLKRQLAKGSSILIRSSDVGYVPKGMQRALIEEKFLIDILCVIQEQLQSKKYKKYTSDAIEELRAKLEAEPMDFPKGGIKMSYTLFEYAAADPGINFSGAYLLAAVLSDYAV